MVEVKIVYPLVASRPIDMEKYGKWPKKTDFSWINGLMNRCSNARIRVSPEILQYQTHVCEDPEYYLREGLTRNLESVEVFLYFLSSHLKLEAHLKVLELCAGTGILTIPLAEYFDVVAIEIKEKYVQWLQDYIRSHTVNGPIKVIKADLTQLNDFFNRIDSTYFDAVLMNPPWNLIRHGFEVAQRYEPYLIIAVMPLDVLKEVEEHHSFRYSAQKSALRENRSFVTEFRQNSAWSLLSCEPALRDDGTAQIGTFLFMKKDKKSD